MTFKTKSLFILLFFKCLNFFLVILLPRSLQKKEKNFPVINFRRRIRAYLKLIITH